MATVYAVPAYMIFTDGELAEIATLSVTTPEELLKIKGIGEKKVEKYATRIIAELAVR
jgi:superfamily II DNA helicase RecQ